MNKHLRLLIMIPLICFIKISTSAQDTVNQKKGKIVLGIGINLLGPKLEMSDLMVKYGFDSQAALFGGGTTIYPQYSSVGFSGLISYSHYVSRRSQLGILFNYSHLGEVLGYSAGRGNLFVSFSNISIVPLYIFGLKETFEFRAGPAFMINSGNNTTDGHSDNPENYTQFSMGLLTGLGAKLWDSRVTFGKFETFYLLTYKNNMGPYTPSASGNDMEGIPESRMNFSHLNFIFALGFKL